MLTVTSTLNPVVDTSVENDHLAGMGAIPHSGGVAFRVWAPNAERVSVIGTFNDWKSQADPLESEGNGFWYGDVELAAVGHEYRYAIECGDRQVDRIDPYARQVTNSIGNGIIRSLEFDWVGDDFELPPSTDLVIYELHIGTFGESDEHRVGDFDAAIAKLDHLHKLGINAVEVLPIGEFAGDKSWGYNPSHLFAVESAYGGPDGFQRFVRECHRRNIGVILDVVYNHFGPSDLHLWQFDGWSENEGGGIYFYNDWRAETPWGATRPDYGRPEVRQYIRDNALMWIDEYHVDGLRLDATVYIRSVRGPADPGSDLPEGWSLVQWISEEVKRRGSRRILIAEDLQDNEWLTKSIGEGGAGFDAQWTAHFVHPVRQAATAAQDEERDMSALANAITHTFNGHAFERVIYSESHDEVANGKSRVPQEVDGDDARSWFARKRSTLAAALVFTTPGIPMLFQGQEFLLGGWFDDNVPVDWDHNESFRGIVRLYRDLIALRLNRTGCTKGLTGAGIEVVYLDHAQKLMAFRRWRDGGPGDEVIVTVNFSAQAAANVRVRVPRSGVWQVRLNSDWSGYSSDFGSSVEAATAEEGDEPFITVTVPPYSAIVYSEDPAQG